MAESAVDQEPYWAPCPRCRNSRRSKVSWSNHMHRPTYDGLPDELRMKSMETWTIDCGKCGQFIHEVGYGRFEDSTPGADLYHPRE